MNKKKFSTKELEKVEFDGKSGGDDVKAIIEFIDNILNIIDDRNNFEKELIQSIKAMQKLINNL